MGKYETIFVIDSLLKTEEIENIITKYEKFISANGGKIEIIDRLGKRRLAFEIKKRQYGFYVLIRFDGLPSMIKALEREYRLNESILRYKTIKLSKMALKALTHQQSFGSKDSLENDNTVVEDKTTINDISPDEDTITNVEPEADAEVDTKVDTKIETEIDTEIDNKNIDGKESKIEN